MRLADVSQLPVLDGGKLVGVIDESDLLLRVQRRRRRASHEPVASAMSDKAADAARPAQAWTSCETCSTAAWSRSSPTHRGFHGLITRFDLLNHLRKALTMKRDAMKRPHDPSSGFATRVIHAGQSPDPTTGAIMPPIYATSTYVQQSPGVHKGLDYGRSHNPTRWAFERCVADLEERRAGVTRSPPAWPRSRPCWNCSTPARTSSPATTSTAARSACSSACASAARASISRFVDLTEPRRRCARRSGPRRRWCGSRRRPTRC